TKRRIVLEGDLPSAMNPPKGCPFCTRCHRKIGDICDNELPLEQLVKDRHVIKCHIPITELSKIEPVIRIPKATERIHAE
ncbi:MAG: ABC transporter ATP-binding protein, partial [Deltaproteobacteria bacterium]|nr:ABC transporter ATP-binding protein [Candidatus Desulfobacula maris]